MRMLQNKLEKQEKERETLKAEVSAAKTQLMNTSDFDAMNELNGSHLRRPTRAFPISKRK